MTISWGCASEVGRIRSLLLKHPRDAFRSAAEIERQWRGLGYSAPPDLERAVREYDALVSLLADSIPEIHFLPADENVGLDSLYVRDAVLMTPGGAILPRMGKPARRGEPRAAARTLERLGIPMIGEIGGGGTMEGGDLAWLDARTLVVGRGYRTSAAGLESLGGLIRDMGGEIIPVPLPHWNGPADVFHLMSFLSPVDTDLAVVYSRLMPVPFREILLERGFRLVEVPDEEYDGMAGNVLALAPRRCLMLDGNPLTRRRLESAGAEVLLYQGEEISRKGAGGPTCLTRPLSRDG